MVLSPGGGVPPVTGATSQLVNMTAATTTSSTGGGGSEALTYLTGGSDFPSLEIIPPGNSGEVSNLMLTNSGASYYNFQAG